MPLLIHSVEQPWQRQAVIIVTHKREERGLSFAGIVGLWVQQLQLFSAVSFARSRILTVFQPDEDV